MTKRLTKITIRDVMGKLSTKETLELAAESTPLVAVAGEVSGFFTKTTNYGDSVGLTGEFAAINLLTGEHFASSKAYLPAGLTEEIVSKMQKLEAGSYISFSANIIVSESDRSPKGYSYVSSPLQTPELVDKQINFFKLLESNTTLKLADNSKKKKTA